MTVADAVPKDSRSATIAGSRQIVFIFLLHFFKNCKRDATERLVVAVDADRTWRRERLLLF